MFRELRKGEQNFHACHSVFILIRSRLSRNFFFPILSLSLSSPSLLSPIRHPQNPTFFYGVNKGSGKKGRKVSFFYPTILHLTKMVGFGKEEENGNMWQSLQSFQEKEGLRKYWLLWSFDSKRFEVERLFLSVRLDWSSRFLSQKLKQRNSNEERER